MIPATANNTQTVNIAYPAAGNIIVRKPPEPPKIIENTTTINKLLDLTAIAIKTAPVKAPVNKSAPIKNVQGAIMNPTKSKL